MHEMKEVSLSRRELLGVAAAAWAALTVAGGRLAGETVGVEPWGRLEKLADGVWAVVSTPLEERNFTTICNGGLVSGSRRILAIDGYGQDAGARWVGGLAREHAGGWPTDVVISHHHGDHVNGLGGFLSPGGEPPRVWMTEQTRQLVLEAADGGDEGRRQMLAAASILDPAKETEIDLGGRSVRVTPRSGHTPSDVTVEAGSGDRKVVFCGDLVWNAMFPNYVDAIPSLLSASVRETVEGRQATYVPGHGPLADGTAVELYLAVIDAVEEAARRSFEKGVAASVAAEEFKLPPPAESWTLFSPNYFERAIGAWHRELKASA